MVAAALGHAARRLSGSSGALRQAQRWLLRRFTHTSGAKAESEGVLMKRIDKRKEEMYDPDIFFV
jgi:hypothetical protein